MAGSTQGGVKAAQTNKQKFGEDFYARIGQKGGRKGRTGGFASKKVGKDGLTGPERASLYNRQKQGSQRDSRRPV